MTRHRAPSGPLKNQILRFILERNQVTIAETATHFQQEQGLARTTILNVMKRRLEIM